MHQDPAAVFPEQPVVPPGLHQHVLPVVGLDVDVSVVAQGQDGLRPVQGQAVAVDELLPVSVVDHAAVEADHVAALLMEAQPVILNDGAAQGAAGVDDHLVPQAQGLLQGGPVAGGDLPAAVQQGAVQVEKENFTVHRVLLR